MFITFDLWDTLILDDVEARRKRTEGRLRRLDGALRACGVSVSADALHAAHEETWQRMMPYWRESRDLPLAGQVGLFLEALGVEVPDAARGAVEHAYAGALFDAPPALIPGAGEVLAELRTRGHRLGLICNTGRITHEPLMRLLDEYGILAHFETTTFSDALEHRKPGRFVFEDTLRRLGADAHACVHVGNDPLTDVTGAKRAGMRAVHLVLPEVEHPPRPGDAVLETPDAVARSYAELPGVLEGIAG